MPFTVLEDFWSDETHSQYCEGLSYTAAVGNNDGVPQHIVEKWIEDGKAQWGAATFSGIKGE